MRRLGPLGAGLAFVAGPFASLAVDVGMVLPLAALDVPWAVAAQSDRGVGASFVIFAAASLALAHRGRITLAAGAAYVLYEAVLGATGITGPLVAVFHVGGFLMGLASGHVLALDEAVRGERGSERG